MCGGGEYWQAEHTGGYCKVERIGFVGMTPGGRGEEYYCQVEHTGSVGMTPGGGGIFEVLSSSKWHV